MPVIFHFLSLYRLIIPLFDIYEALQMD